VARHAGHDPVSIGGDGGCRPLIRDQYRSRAPGASYQPRQPTRTGARGPGRHYCLASARAPARSPFCTTAHTRNAQRAFFANDPALSVAGQVAPAGSRMGLWRPHEGIAMSDQPQDPSTTDPRPQQLPTQQPYAQHPFYQRQAPTQQPPTQQPHYPPPVGSQPPPAHHRRRWARVWARGKSYVAATARARVRQVPHG